MDNYMSTKEAAAKWGISVRQVQNHCKNNRIPGVQRFGNTYVIPKDAVKPRYMFVCVPDDSSVDNSDKQKNYSNAVLILITNEDEVVYGNFYW